MLNFARLNGNLSSRKLYHSLYYPPELNTVPAFSLPFLKFHESAEYFRNSLPLPIAAHSLWQIQTFVAFQLATDTICICKFHIQTTQIDRLDFAQSHTKEINRLMPKILK